MRKLREVVVVTAMVGSVGLLGGGIATAQAPGIACTQTNGDTVENGDVDLPLLATLTPGAGDADSRAQQNNCGIDVEDNVNTSGDATGGDVTPAVAVTP